MENYPKTLMEFEECFATEEACRAYLAAIRWPDGFRCPACGGMEAWHSCEGLWICRNCQRKTSVTAGTIFQDTRKGLRTWFRAMWLVCNQKNGVSALGIQRVLGLASYQTAWTWLHKLRRAMVRPGRDRLSGCVEIDETYVGGAKPGKRGWGAAGKAMVLVATEVDGRKVGRIRLARTTDGTAANLEAFVQMSVELGSIIRTDGNQSYCGLPALGYRHEVIVMKDAEGDETKMLPQTHLVASLLKRWLLGTHQGGVQHHWLDYYLDEFTFRFNRRTSQARGQLFYRLIQQAVQVGPASYDAIITIHHPIRLQKMGLLQSSG